MIVVLLGLANFIRQPSDFSKVVTERIITERANASKTFDQDPNSDYDKMEDVVTAVDFDFLAFSRNTPDGQLIDL